MILYYRQDGGVSDSLETRHTPHVWLYQILSHLVKPFGRR